MTRGVTATTTRTTTDAAMRCYHIGSQHLIEAAAGQSINVRRAVRAACRLLVLARASHTDEEV